MEIQILSRTTRTLIHGLLLLGAFGLASLSLASRAGATGDNTISIPKNAIAHWNALSDNERSTINTLCLAKPIESLGLTNNSQAYHLFELENLVITYLLSAAEYRHVFNAKDRYQYFYEQQQQRNEAGLGRRNELIQANSAVLRSSAQLKHSELQYFRLNKLVTDMGFNKAWLDRTSLNFLPEIINIETGKKSEVPLINAINNKVSEFSYLREHALNVARLEEVNFKLVQIGQLSPRKLLEATPLEVISAYQLDRVRAEYLQLYALLAWSRTDSKSDKHGNGLKVARALTLGIQSE